MATSLQFRLRSQRASDKSHEVLVAHLVSSDWDDFGFRTSHFLKVYDERGEPRTIGMVKICSKDATAEGASTTLPRKFERLPPTYCSLGQSEAYYRALAELSPELRSAVLHGLQDVVADNTHLKRALRWEGFEKSLLRKVSLTSVTGQFRRVLEGGARLEPFGFVYSPRNPRSGGWRLPNLSFQVHPNSTPSTNVHAIIGCNGVGKSHLLRAMASLAGNRAVFRPDPAAHPGESKLPLASVVLATFSALDDPESQDGVDELDGRVRHYYIGPPARDNSMDSVGALAGALASSLEACIAHGRDGLWHRLIEMLETDPLFKDAGISGLLKQPRGRRMKGVMSKFRGLSSGQKSVVLAITRLVEVLEERTLVLIDEPETHLHPPLLSSFVRALSELVVHRNAVAVIATHSPVVLQELPRSCVWVLRRSGREVIAERPQIETFGENLGALTREVFQLDVRQAGFRQLLAKAAASHSSYEASLIAFGGQLGAEARAILKAMVIAKKQVAR